MEIVFTTNLISLFLFLSILFAFGIQWRRRSKISSNNPPKKLPPGPRKLPLIGNMHNLIGSLQHHVLRNLSRKHGPLIHLKLGEMEAIVVSSSRLAKEIMKTHDLSFADRADLLAGKTITYNSLSLGFSPYNETWRESRRICVQQLLSPKQVRTFRPIREEECYQLISNISDRVGKPFDLSFNVWLSNSKIVSRATFGKVCRDQETFQNLFKEIFRVGVGFEFADFFPSYKMLHALTRTERKMLKLREKLDLIMDEVINEYMMNLHHKNIDNAGEEEDEEDHIIGVLLRIKERGDLQIPFGYDNIKAILFDMFFAGTESSVTTVEWAMSEMMKNPHVMAKAQKEIREAFKGMNKINEEDIQCLKYMRLVIKETLRLHPPAPLTLRQCRKECDVDGYNITVGTKVFINVWAIARDPEYWDDAESFIPERFENSALDYSGHQHEYIPFGSGRRMCPGSAFGLANVELPLALLLYHFDWELPNGIKSKDFDMTEAPGISVSRKTHLCLIPTSFLVG